MRTTIGILILIIMVAFGTNAQEKIDTVTINFGEKSKLVIIVHDREDLSTLAEYDLNAILEDIKMKLDTVNGESRLVDVSEEENQTYLNDTTITVETKNVAVVVNKGSTTVEVQNETTPEKNPEEEDKRRRYRTKHSFNFDFGINQVMEDGKFPEANNAPYAVRPWGSWYVGINSVNNFHLGGRIFAELGFGVSWYNFKFQDHSIRILKTDDGLEFYKDPETNRSFVKSKLTATYINASLVPIIQLGSKVNNRKNRVFDSKYRPRSGVRLGLGGYVGYRIDSYTKYVYRVNGDKKKEHHKDNYYLDNLRYGIRAQIGIKSTDFFINYDLNKLFYEGKGPNLNAFSFGVTF